MRQFFDTPAKLFEQRSRRFSRLTRNFQLQTLAFGSAHDHKLAGSVRFEPLGPDRTRVNLTMEYDPKGVVENVGDAVGVFSSRVQNTVEDFKKFIESRGGETGGWRGEVRGGQKTS